VALKEEEEKASGVALVEEVVAEAVQAHIQVLLALLAVVH